ncbi:MAG: Tetratricopeptide TPR_1 repeat-containing protein [uncultured bacterium]|nr:MAG: Tetratricopeptide TPR_1 repeat-containing protein [uncultured bacterium]
MKTKFYLELPVKNTQGQSRFFIAILISLIVGFTTGVVVTVYKAPSILSKMPQAQQQGPSPDEIAKHIKHMEAEAAKNPQDFKGWIGLGNAYFDAEIPDKAINAYLKALALSPDSPDVLTDLGVMYRRNKQLDKAIEAFDKAAKIDTTHIQSRFNKGVVLFHDMNDKEGAIKAWEEVAKLQPAYSLSTGQTIQQLLESIK